MKSPLHTVRKLAGKVKDARADRKVRNRSTGFRFALADDVRFLNPEHWDSVAAQGGFFMSRSYLQLVVDHGPGNIVSRCALIFRDETPVAAVAVQIVTVEGKRVVKTAAA